MLQLHVATWALSLILFVITYFLYKRGIPKASNIAHMILRVIYILVIASGVILIVKWVTTPGVVNPGPIYVKAILGLIVVSLMEMIIIRTQRRDSKIRYWVLFFLSILLVFYYGYFIIY
ncbi:YisL family protein [Fictibacillus gelatini]|uniref:YisL family protein n=1 Tax=Fictibacillus gelatini TaxID=225985 RepID=UPI000429FE8A|nr:YisL family protein [Fictibacillus gelatini]